VAAAGLASAQSMLARAVIRAPISGIVLSRAVEPGQTVTAGTLLAKVARPEPLKAEIRVPEFDVAPP